MNSTTNGRTEISWTYYCGQGWPRGATSYDTDFARAGALAARKWCPMPTAEQAEAFATGRTVRLQIGYGYIAPSVRPATV